MAAADEEQAAIGASAMKKAMWRIIPLILLAYLFAYMDRVNVSFAAADMNADLGFSATVYGLGGGLFFLGYALFEIPSNLLLVRYGARQWIARIMITWGLLSAGMMFVTNAETFYALRFLLGVAEAGFYPGVIYYFSSWFPPCHRSRAVSRFFIAVPLASLVMGAVSGWLLDLEGLAGLAGWQWLFLAQGLPTVLVGFVVLAFLPDRPATVGWLTPAERDWIEDELAREQQQIGDPPGHNVLAALRNPKVQLNGALSFLLIGANITFTLSAPMVLAAVGGLGRDAVGWTVAAGGIIGAVTILWLGHTADRRGDRFIYAFWCTAVIAASLLVIALGGPAFVIVAFYLAFAIAAPSVQMLLSSAWPEVMTRAELAVGAAAINTIAQIGAFFTPFAWGALKDKTGSFTAGLYGIAAMAAVCAGLIWVLRTQVRRRGVLTALQ
ncbi:MFS transporter [Erythrobacter oryzae]|uniref:MFS transporter n=1 Tax=Erythrobacter oryzae TaxID=3019556 RepID=UPI0025560F29|nr:MFS transporter [Erythrobacter sp. COR-2]